MALRFTVLASGSSGNAALVQTDHAGLLLDIGLGPRQLAQRLAAVGSSWRHVRAVLLTHTHTDHWNERTLAHLRRQQIPIFCHGEHHFDLLNNGEAFAGLLADNLVHSYEADQELEPIAGVRCRALSVPHDCGATFGFRLEMSVGLFGQGVALGYVTDLGSWTPALAQELADVDVLALEFNHDVDMQYASGRSPLLIQRILSDHGHLSNAQAAALLQEILRLSTPGRLQHVVQLHLSRDCNRPALAKQAAKPALASHLTTRIYSVRHDRPGPRLVIGPGGVKKQAAEKRLLRSGSNFRRPANQAVFPGFD